MTDRETRYERRSEAPLVPALSRHDESAERRRDSTDDLRTRVDRLVRPLLSLTGRGRR